jgi:hypothetical protein
VCLKWAVLGEAEAGLHKGIDAAAGRRQALMRLTAIHTSQPTVHAVYLLSAA